MSLQKTVSLQLAHVKLGSYDTRNTVIQTVKTKTVSTDKYKVGSFAQIDNNGYLITTNTRGTSGVIIYMENYFAQMIINDSFTGVNEYSAGDEVYIATLGTGIVVTVDTTEVPSGNFSGLPIAVSRADSSLLKLYSAGNIPSGYDATPYIIETKMPEGTNIFKIRSV